MVCVNQFKPLVPDEEMAEGEKVGQEQIHDLLFKDTLSWQAIIYDLINSEQLDPWDIDIFLLSQKYLEKVRALEEANFFISSKVLFAAALLLRIKSEILLNRDIPALDEILMGKKENSNAHIQERIELGDEVPELVPRTPLPRFRKVSLEELMSALNQAIATESRRIKKAVLIKQQEYEVAVAMPKNTFKLKEHVSYIYNKLKAVFSNGEKKIAFSEFMEAEYEDKRKRIMAFVSLLHLDHQHRIWLEQEGNFDEIWILLKTMYEKQNKGILEKMRKEVEEYFKNNPEKESGKEMSEDEIEDDGGNGISKKEIREYSGFGEAIE